MVAGGRNPLVPDSEDVGVLGKVVSWVAVGMSVCSEGSDRVVLEKSEKSTVPYSIDIDIPGSDRQIPRFLP